MKKSFDVSTIKGITCFNCKKGLITKKFGLMGGDSKEYTIVECNYCSLAFISASDFEQVDYSEYGDHIATQNDSYFFKRKAKTSLLKKSCSCISKRDMGLIATFSILDVGRVSS